MDADGAGQTRLTTHNGNDWTPRFSPDGTHIAFVSDRGGDFSVYTMVIDGSNVRLVADAHPHDYYPDWSPDGTRIAFFSGTDFDSFQVWVVDLETGDLRQVTAPPGTASNPTWSPDGERLLVGSEIDGAPTLRTVRSDGSDARSLFAD